MKKKIILISIIAALFVSIGLVLAHNKETIDQQKVVVDRSKIPVAVTVAKASLKTMQGDLQLPATLEPSKQADISATTAGKIAALRIQLGSRVSQGQVIGNIDIRQQQLGENDAREALTKAERDYQLSQELYAGNAGTAQSVKDAAHNLEAARIRLQQSGQKVGDGLIKSPISGIITVKNGEVGEYANPGTSIATVVDIYHLKAVVFVGEKDVYQLSVGRTASLSADVLPGKSFNGKVSYIAPVGDDNHNYRVELEINNAATQLKAGTYVKVAFDLGNHYSALQIPKLALVEGTKNPFVYVAASGKAVMRKITVGREAGENIEVLSGLQEGDEVVISGQINLTDGNRINSIK